MEKEFKTDDTTMIAAKDAEPQEPGVVRIVRERRVQQPIENRKDLAAQPPETPVFELSIGTVNVVIEDDQPRTAPVAPARSETTRSGSQPERSRPRLSRSYL